MTTSPRGTPGGRRATWVHDPVLGEVAWSLADREPDGAGPQAGSPGRTGVSGADAEGGSGVVTDQARGVAERLDELIALVRRIDERLARTTRTTWRGDGFRPIAEEPGRPER